MGGDSGGGGGGGGGGGDEFPVDDLGELNNDGGDFNDLDDMSDPIPPPEGDDGWAEEEARAGADVADLEREPPPDDGSGERPFAAAPGGGGGPEAGGAMPDGTPEEGAEVNTKTDGSDGGMGVEMVADMGDDQYPDEGQPF
jgi:hypothetical protein